MTKESALVLQLALYLVLRKLGFGAAGSANLQHLPGYPNSQARFSPDSLQICRRKIFTDSHSFLQNFVVNQEYGVNQGYICCELGQLLPTHVYSGPEAWLLNSER